jgi:Flp pilus assembly protein TadG
LSALRRDESGLAVVEFAFVAAIMIFMYLGSTQLSDAINASRRVTITARALADLASRTPTDVGSRIGELKESQITTIIAASAQVLQPYDLDNADIRVSEVWKCGAPSNPNTNPTYNPANASLADSNPSKFDLTKCLSPNDALTDSSKPAVVGVQWSRTNGGDLAALTAATVTLPPNIQTGTVIIRADKRVAWDYVAAAMRMCNLAGIHDYSASLADEP